MALLGLAAGSGGGAMGVTTRSGTVGNGAPVTLSHGTGEGVPGANAGVPGGGGAACGVYPYVEANGWVTCDTPPPKILAFRSAAFLLAITSGSFWKAENAPRDAFRPYGSDGLITVPPSVAAIRAAGM